RPAWKRYADPDHHFRVLFSHEYAHRLQSQGLWTNAYGIEIPAVAVELLRALELAPLSKLAAGHIDFIGQGVLDSFEDGRRWLRDGGTSVEAFYRKGALAGAAYELSLKTGRPDDAWEFLRRVCAIRPGSKAGENPAEAAAAIASRP
ncbi:MAG: hypothetical protein HY927_15445, partial [Elusimicrobia bacterium]|nr:hypothetical protein [Elusimicrobiota bacterium]